ncbi:hypothetical protein TNCV_2288541 [Trichonephila clavipes]|nr:hypothetical protein TNCV_2288541 [Trichonephila clavipes]
MPKLWRWKLVVTSYIVPSRNFPPSKFELSPVWFSRPTTAVLLAPCHDEFRGPRSDYVRQLSENESDDGELSCSNLSSDEDIRLSTSDCKKSEESADVIDNIPVNRDTYVARNRTE